MKESKSLTTKLLGVLEAEEKLYVEMRNLLQNERELMVELDAAGLERVAMEKAALADEGRLIEETRLALCGELAAELGLAAARPTLSRLCGALGEESRPLRDQHTRLVVLVTAVRELVDANRNFAGDCLAQVHGTLRLLGRLLPENAAYGADARVDGGTASGHLVRRTA